jgi:hypothetical protein
MYPQDAQLATILKAPAPATIADVIERMQAMDAVLPTNDGLKWFNWLYLKVTQQVDLNPPGGAWRNPQWLTRLDVVFAGLYFDAVAGYLSGTPIPAAWSAMLDARMRTGIDRIQFALAGMNAHIDHDLAMALLTTDSVLNVVPTKGGAEYADFESVNSLLKGLMPLVLTTLASDTLGVLAEDAGKVGRMLAFWDLCQARNLAWDFADELHGLGGIERAAALDAQNATTGGLGRALLAF